MYVVLVLLAIAAVKIRTRGFGPDFSFGGDETEFTPTVSDTEVDGGNILSRLKAVPESEPGEMPGATSKSSAESIEDGEHIPLEFRSVEEWNLPDMPESTREMPAESKALIAEIISYVNAKPARIIGARDKLNEMLSMPMSEQQLAFVKEQLSKLAKEWLFSRMVLPGDTLCRSYQVKPGDQFGTIGGKFKIPYEIIMWINNIKRPEALRAGETIKVINGPFHVRICRSTFTLDLYLGDTFVHSFPVGLGGADKETPTGLWRVKVGGKLVSPIWTNPDTGRIHQAEDPDYPLGSRWIGLEGLNGDAEGRTGFAIHGTRNSGQVGKAGSRGCIRMNDNDVILVYDLLMPGFSQVVVVE